MNLVIIYQVYSILLHRET